MLRAKRTDIWHAKMFTLLAIDQLRFPVNWAHPLMTDEARIVSMASDVDSSVHSSIHMSNRLSLGPSIRLYVLSFVRSSKISKTSEILNVALKNRSF